jgi:hypothetical protein
MQLAREERTAIGLIDDVLGDESRRYFGTGYRKVNHRIRDVCIDTGEKRATATAEISYPIEWSLKKQGELRPHLSSVDAVVLSEQLGEAYVREAYGLDDAMAARMWLRRCILKAGATPTLELDAIPLKVNVVETVVAPDSDGGYRTRFTSQIGSMAVDFSLDHPIAQANPVLKRTCADIEELLGSAAERFFGQGYKAGHLRIKDVEVNGAQQRVSAKVESMYPPACHVTRGAGATFYPFLTCIEAIVSIAQLAQVALYAQDEISRDRSHTLWMRRVAITSLLPVGGPELFDIGTWMIKSAILPFGGQRWRVGTFGVTFPGVGMDADYSVAHQLP